MKADRFRRRLAAGLATTLALVGLATPPPVATAAPADDVLVDEDFAGAGLPTGWTSVLGDWQVVDGRLQATAGTERARIAFGPQAPENFRIESLVRFVAVADANRWLNIGVDYHVAQDWGAVLVARSATTGSSGLELAQAAQGGGYVSNPTGPAPVAIGTGEDHVLAVEVRGSDAVVSIDGQTAMTASNLNRTGGGFGFVINRATVQFDDVVVTELPGPEVLIDEDFSDGGLPQGWTSVLGDWQVVDGRLQGTTGNPRVRVGFGPTAPQNFRLDTTVRFVSVTNSSRWLNVGVDYHAAADWGAVGGARAATTASNGLELAQAAQGGSYASNPVAASPVALGVGEDHQLTVEVTGTELAVSIDGRTAMRATNLKRTGGAFGFVLNNATVQFDNVRLVKLPDTPAQPVAPGAPQQLHLAEDGDRATVTWEAPASAGADADGTPATLQGYEVSIAPAGTATSQLTWRTAEGTSHTFAEVPDSAEQVIRVRAVNSADAAGPAASVVTLRGAATVDGLKLRLTNGPWPTSHVQGIAVDKEKGFIYYSFTTLLVKTDLAGNIVGTIGGFNGHLGDLDFNPSDGRVYGSLEYKSARAFYIAVIDVDRINRVGMTAQNSDVFATVHLQDVVDDFTADMNGDGKFDGDTANTPDHRYGSSGIDGVAFGPAFGSTDGKQYLTVAHGIYSNTSRTDNDHQVILQYDVTDWPALERPLVESAPHRSGPEVVDGKFFVFTGNTTYGVQNLEYDPWLQRWFMGVYNGVKPQYPNYGLYAVDATSQPVLSELQGVGGEQGLLLPLADDGLRHEATGIRGWNANASVGIQSMGHGLFYLVTATSTGGQGSVMTLQAWTGDPQRPFAPVTTDYRVAPQFTSGAPATATVGQAYQHRFTARSFPAAEFHVVGELPAGLELAPDGTLAGTPAADGRFSFDVVASNGHEEASQRVDLLVLPEAWSATATYGAGDRVSHQGSAWTARWWTRDQLPGDPYGPWEEIVTTEDGTAVWTPSRVFLAGDVVLHDGTRYRAKWWTRNQRPGDPHGPWQPLA